MNRPLRLGFIGGGVNSAVGPTHFIAARMDGRFTVDAGCFSRHPDINMHTAQRWTIPPERVYSRFEDMLSAEQGSLDAIVILTPTSFHTEPVIQALRHGFPVICEKALTDSSADAQQIRQVLEATGGFLAVTYNYSGYPMLRELQWQIGQGKFGRVEQVHIEMPQEGFARLDREGKSVVPQQWRLCDKLIPTISLDLGAHVHHIINYLTGEKPREVVAMQSSLGRFREVVDNVVCLARYTKELECGIWFSKAALGYRNGLRVRVFGEKGSAEWHQMDPEFLYCHDNQGRAMVIERANVEVELACQPRYNRFKAGHPAGFLEAFANLYADIGDDLNHYQETGYQTLGEHVFSVEHSLEGLLMLEAMALSSQSHRWEVVGGGE